MKLEYRLLYVTVPSPEVADTIAEKLVGDGLVACANIVPGASSIYRWQGEIVRDTEVLLIAKTVADRVDAVIAAIRPLHPYTCPCIVAVPLVGGHEPFLDWIEEQTRGRA